MATPVSLRRAGDDVALLVRLHQRVLDVVEAPGRQRAVVAAQVDLVVGHAVAVPRQAVEEVAARSKSKVWASQLEPRVNREGMPRSSQRRALSGLVLEAQYVQLLSSRQNAQVPQSIKLLPHDMHTPS